MAKKFDPATDVPICFMTPAADGRILSRAFNVPGAKNIQYARSCDHECGLPRPSTANSHALTVDTNEVTCPKCHKTKAFLDAYQTQHNGVKFSSEEEEAAIPTSVAKEAETPDTAETSNAS